MTYKSVPSADVFRRFPTHVQEAGAIRGEQLVLEYTKRQVRDIVALAKKDAENSDKSSDGTISTKEERLRLRLHTLEKHLAAIGGKLRFVVELPDRPSVTLSLKGRIISTESNSAPD